MATHYQYAFIGSGVAGATVAKRLLEHDANTSILMLDAGPEVKAKDRRYWWDYVIFGRKPYDYCYDVDGENITSGDINWEFVGSRAMAYGGSTLHWGGWCLRYKPEDFRLQDQLRRGRRLAHQLRGPRALLRPGRALPVGVRRRGRELEPDPQDRAVSPPALRVDGRRRRHDRGLRVRRHPARADADRPLPQVHDDRHLQVLPVRRPVSRRSTS